MKQVGNILLVEVPEGVSEIEVVDYFNGRKHSLVLDFFDANNDYRQSKLPPGDWQLLRSCAADKLSLEDAKKVMPFTVGYESGLESLHEFVRSQGYEPPKVVILVKID
jgi:hypothetical protein